MPSETLALGFDTSGSRCAAALALGGEILAESCEEMARGHAEALFPMLEAILKSGGKSWRDLGAIGVGVGPGSFTGIRIGVSAARGLAMSLRIPAMGISRLDALAHGLETPVLTSVDARQNRICWQLVGAKGSKPEICDLDALPQLESAPKCCVGFKSQNIAARYGTVSQSERHLPGTSVALLAAQGKTGSSPPKPLYMRNPFAQTQNP